MSDLIIPSSSPITLPAPRVPIVVRVATPGDLPFIDSLQKMHTQMVGWMPTKQLEGKISSGHVLVAEEVASGQLPVAGEGKGFSNPPPLTTNNSQLTTPTPVGYVIGHDQYFKRDDVGIIYQMNVVPGKQRSFVGAHLLKAMFDRAAYGCRLFCCWCAQDIAANYFWESMGFVPLAYRAGSEKRSRVHIFWQKRIRSGDVQTPWWFPCKTNSGSIREDRIVLPIPPGTHWSDAKPMILPAAELPVVSGQLSDFGEFSRTVAEEKRRPAKKAKPNEKRKAFPRNGMWFDVPRQGQPIAIEKPEGACPERSRREKKQKTPRVKAKHDPRLVAAARELRDKYLEQINSERLLPPVHGKYDVSRQIEATEPKQPSGLIEQATIAA